MPQRTITWMTSALAVAACATVAACSGPGSAGNPQPGSGGQGPAASAGQVTHAAVARTYCAKAPSSMVGPALGIAAGKLVATVEGPVTVCAYLGSSEVIVRYQVGEDATQFAADKTSMSKLHQSVTSVSGLGDAAFFAAYGSGTASSDTLAVRQGDIAVFITAPAALTHERTLASKLLAKL